MGKVLTIIVLFSIYVIYSGWVFSPGTSSGVRMTQKAINGKNLWHSNNCQNCHQVFGLGGYMGPDLTTVTTDKSRGKLYAKAMLMNGGTRMPNFHFTENQADELVAYLDYVNNASTLQQQ
ncbi:MAG: hypothetical protein K0Q79_870 [Flavipsychrobacter sp.]|jgi:nitric oxide reductase subunit C|nr:hypothetical protein [Flavipsychrobacter sp.]